MQNELNRDIFEFLIMHIDFEDNLKEKVQNHFLFNTL